MAKISSQRKRHGPRSRVFAHLSRYIGLENTAEWTGKTVKDGESFPLPSKDDAILKTLYSGYMQLYSFFSPGLPEGSYTATVTQNISITQAGKTTTEPTLVTGKQFSVEGPKWSVDPKVVDSVYPPPAHRDYPSILPSIIFNDPHYPWLVGMEESQEPDRMEIPWLGLLVFTESEITPSTEQINILQQKLPAQNPKSKSFSMKVSDLVSLDSLISQPVPPIGDAVTDSTLVDVVLVSSTLFDGIFGGSSGSSNSSSGRNSQPDLTRFMYMSHVKNVNVTNLPGEKRITDDDVGQFSVTVCPRTGPLDLKDDTTLYVHLVSLVNVAEQIAIPSGKTEALTALISLYSWSYTCIPAEKVSVYDTLRNLGQSVQPFRLPDFHREDPPDETKSERMARQRLDAGYSLVNYRLRTGEQTLAFQRGPLSPTPTPHPMGGYPQQSNFGTDLIILDNNLGILDLTYQLAWQLGRAVAMSDRVFVAALLRLRATIHEQALAKAKIALDDKFKNKQTILKDFSKVIGNLNYAQGKQQAENNPQGPPFALRWQRSTPRQRSLRGGLTFGSQSVQQAYTENIPSIVRQNALGSTNSLYNEFNSPVSPDYAVILEWCLDRFFLHGIPYHYIVPSGMYVPKESIRTFYLDDNWLDVFIDGALSLGNYYARDTDCIRTSIKKVFNEYLTTYLPNGHLPQIPRWGFILRSEIVAKFPDLVISAPWSNVNDQKLEVVKIDKPDTDMLLCLFDRVPEDGSFKGGITFIPPEHQTRFELGVKLTPDSLQIEWKRVYTGSEMDSLDCATKVYIPPAIQTYKADDHIFDFNNRCLIFPQFAQKASDALKEARSLHDDVAPTPALTGVQLIADISKLKLADGTQAYKPSPQRQIYLGTKDCEPPQELAERPGYVLEERKGTKETSDRCSSVTHRTSQTPRELSGNVGEHSHPAGLGHHHHAPESSLGSSVVPNPGTSLSTETAGNDSPSQLQCTFICGALACGTSISVISQFSKSPLLPPNFDVGGPTPKWSSQLPPLVDQGFSIVATTKQRGWCVEYIQVTIPVGNRSSDLLSPFVTGQEQLFMAETNTAAPGSGPSTDLSKLSCAPAKPQTSFGKLEIPEVVPFSRARRFLPSVNYYPETPPSVCGRLVVRMRPISREVSDLMDSYDASFMIKQPRINWTERQGYTVEIVEKYRSIPPGADSSVHTTNLIIEGCYASERKDTGKVDISC